MCFLYLHQGSSSTEEWILVSCPFLHFSSPTAFRVNKPTRIILEVQPGSGSWPSLWPFSTSRLHWPEFSLIRTAAALEETHQRHQFFMWWSFFSPPPEQELEKQTAVRKQTLQRLCWRGKPGKQSVLFQHPHIRSWLFCKMANF